MDNIPVSTIDEQIDKLKEQRLIIEDEKFARVILSTFGYSNVIKSYRDPYMVFEDDKKVYRSNVTFGQIYSLYILDKNLRNAIISAMLDLEEFIKATAADVISTSFGTHQNNYICYRHYANKTKKKPQFTLTHIIDTLKKTLLTDKDPVHHYYTEHGIVPPWILFKSIYFSTIVNFIDQFKTPEKDMMVKKMYQNSNLNLDDLALRQLMMDTLFLSLDYRNVAAHCGRIYNYSPPYSCKTDFTQISKLNSTEYGLGRFCFILGLLNYQQPYRWIHSTLKQEVNRHCSMYPQDVTYLGQILNVNIQQKTVVWISDNSKLFHTNPHCSGMSNAREVIFTPEIQGKYRPCKRCTSPKQ